ncbi:hypothetical protein EK904_014461 [Melospiza melodia maxima]|nr:hypothetical protein EK904_014461 [Melospiza melodia maxima]
MFMMPSLCQQVSLSGYPMSLIYLRSILMQRNTYLQFISVKNEVGYIEKNKVQESVWVSGCAAVLAAENPIRGGSASCHWSLPGQISSTGNVIADWQVELGTAVLSLRLHWSFVLEAFPLLLLPWGALT